MCDQLILICNLLIDIDLWLMCGLWRINMILWSVPFDLWPVYNDLWPSTCDLSLPLTQPADINTTFNVHSKNIWLPPKPSKNHPKHWLCSRSEKPLKKPQNCDDPCDAQIANAVSAYLWTLSLIISPNAEAFLIFIFHCH